jgi:hypothetical protein
MSIWFEEGVTVPLVHIAIAHKMRTSKRLKYAARIAACLTCTGILLPFTGQRGELLFKQTDVKLFAKESRHYQYKELDFFYRDYREIELEKCASLTFKEPNSRSFNSSYLGVCSEDCPNFTETSVKSSEYDIKQTTEVVQHALKHAWREWDISARPIDLFVRSGCRDTNEIGYLFESVELFWPRGLGHIIVVLDEADALVAKQNILPTQTKHKYRIFYEQHPCMPGRVFNQISYLMADHYSTAEILVTIDSDCVLHSPVTPELLFNEEGRILLPWSTNFQRNMWNDAVEYFTGPGTFRGHSMITQPVTIHRSTLTAYREWYVKKNGRCLLQDVAAFVDEFVHIKAYCWMCQINTFIQLTNETADAYELVDIDSPLSRAYLRFSMHITHESLSGGTLTAENTAEFSASVNAAINQGLCHWLGQKLLQHCQGADLSYLKRRLFNYAGHPMHGDEEKRRDTERKYHRSLNYSLVATGNDI